MSKLTPVLIIIVLFALAECHPDEPTSTEQTPLVDIEHHHEQSSSSSHTHDDHHKTCTCGHHGKPAQSIDLIPVPKDKHQHKCPNCKEGDAQCTCQHSPQPHPHNFLPNDQPQTCSNCGKGQCSCQSDPSNPSLLPPRSHSCKNCKRGNCDRCQKSQPHPSQPIYIPSNMRLS